MNNKSKLDMVALDKGVGMEVGERGREKGVAKERGAQCALSQHSQRGATMVEYSIMLAMIVGSCVVTVGVLGFRTNQAFYEVENAIGGIVGLGS